MSDNAEGPLQKYNKAQTGPKSAMNKMLHHDLSRRMLQCLRMSHIYSGAV